MARLTLPGDRAANGHQPKGGQNKDHQGVCLETMTRHYSAALERVELAWERDGERPGVPDEQQAVRLEAS